MNRAHRDLEPKAALSAASGIEPTGCGSSTRGNSLKPRVAASARASVMNSSVMSVAVETPRLSSSTASWTLHDVHEPQSPNALMTASQSSVNSLNPSAPVRVIFRLEISLRFG